MPKTMLLPVQITDAEKLIISGEQSVLITEIEKLKAEKAGLPERIKTLEGSLYLKNHALIAGVIEREVEIREESNAFAAKVKIYRVDTNEFVKERGMDPEEAQMQLGNSSVPGPVPDNVRSLAEHREKTEEQLAAGTPEEAEALREARLADEAAQRVNDMVAGLSVAITARGPTEYVASVEGALPGIASGFSGPIRETPELAKAELLEEVRRLVIGAGGVPAPAVEADPARVAEIAALAEQQAADDAKDKPKRLLKAPKGSKAKKAADPAPATDNPNGVDIEPPPGAAF